MHEVHSHSFVSGPRTIAGYRNGKWVETTFQHSHEGGGVPHSHPHTGPSFYGYRKPKTTRKPSGEQFPYIARTEEESTFELVLLDSAKIGGTEPVGDRPIESLGFPAAERLMTGSRLRCVVRDERKQASPKETAHV